MDTIKIKASKLKRQNKKMDILEAELKVALNCERALVRMVVKTCTLLEVIEEKFKAILTEEEQTYYAAIKEDYANILSAYSIERSGVTEAQQSGEEIVEGLQLDPK